MMTVETSYCDGEDDGERIKTCCRPRSNQYQVSVYVMYVSRLCNQREIYFPQSTWGVPCIT